MEQLYRALKYVEQEKQWIKNKKAKMGMIKNAKQLLVKGQKLMKKSIPQGFAIHNESNFKTESNQMEEPFFNEMTEEQFSESDDQIEEYGINEQIPMSYEQNEDEEMDIPIH